MKFEHPRILFTIVVLFLCLLGIVSSRAWATTVTPIFGGGTGTSTAPAYGQLLLGNSVGGYNLSATSSLGITSGSGISWPWSALTNWGTTTNATTTSYTAPAYFASSTLASQFPYASSTAQSVTNLFATYASTTAWSTTSTSTGTNGINLSGGCFALSGTCISGGGGGGISLGYIPWGGSISTNYGTTTIASTTPAWFQEGLYASSTSQFNQALFQQSSSSQTTVGGATHEIYAGTGNIVFGDSNGGPNLTWWAQDGPPPHALTLSISSIVGAQTQSFPPATGTFTLGTGTQNQVAYWSSTNVVTGSANLTFNGSSLGIASSTPTVAVSLGANDTITTTEASTSGASATIYDNWFTNQQTKIEANTGITIHEQNDTLPGMTHRLIFCQDGTGSRTLTWGTASSSIIWSGGSPPTQTSTANACDVYSFITTGATGTIVTLGAATQNFP